MKNRPKQFNLGFEQYVYDKSGCINDLENIISEFDEYSTSVKTIKEEFSNYVLKKENLNWIKDNYQKMDYDNLYKATDELISSLSNSQGGQ